MTDGRSERAAAYRAMYRTKDWQAVRKARLKHEPMCRTCARLGRATPAAIVDHIQPHRGNRALFFSLGNTQSLCKPHHDSNKAQAERGGVARIAVGGDGWPIAS